jgi:aldehyde dehydrogenase (NAD+)
MTADTVQVSVPAPGPVNGDEQEIFRRQQVFTPTLRRTTARDRLAKLEKLRRAIEARRSEIQQAAAADFRKPPEEVELGEIFPVLHEIGHARRHLKKWMKPAKVRPTIAMLGTQAQIRYEPKGVCLIISPWNYPFNLTFGPLVSAIAAGNTAIIKPSELTPNCSRLIRQIVEDLYSPDEVAVFEGDADVAQQLLALPFNHIFFTGSPAVGRIVMQAASRHLASVTLELGGKSPAIVDETADIDKTVGSLVWGKFVNNGQTCIAPDYVYVQERVRDAFLEKVRERIEKVLGNTSAGGSCVNTCAAHFLHGNLPFGGVNNSGIGNAHGEYGFKTFSHERAVLTDWFSSSHMLSPPYTDKVRKLLRMTSKYFA